jgi:hypothetical protein
MRYRVYNENNVQKVHREPSLQVLLKKDLALDNEMQRGVRGSQGLKVRSEYKKNKRTLLVTKTRENTKDQYKKTKRIRFVNDKDKRK